MNQTRKLVAARPVRARRQEGRSLTIALLNNMADGALQATEEQFCGLLREAAPGDVELKFRYFSLRELERGDAARAHMLGRYEYLDELFAGGVDGLVVTGAEPRAATFEAESYWPSLARVIDWSEAEAIPTVWSCLAAHAAAWRLDGIARNRLPAKHSGVFTLDLTTGHPLLEGSPAGAAAPHSRLNDLGAREIEAAGYQILARLGDGSVDTFVRPGPPLSLFFQGHPEYDAGALRREYLRDVSRFLRGQQAHHPSEPAGYFQSGTLEILQNLAEESVRTRNLNLLDRYAQALQGHAPLAAWRPWALHVYRAWLSQAFQVKGEAVGRLIRKQ